MPTDQIPYLECKNERCRHTIWLPRSSQLDKSPDQPGSRTQLVEEAYVCPTCGHVYGYTRLNVHWTPLRIGVPANLGALSAVAVIVVCEQGNCGVPVLLRKTTWEHLDRDKLLKQAESWVLAGVQCDSGHRVNRIPPDSLVTTISMP